MNPMLAAKESGCLLLADITGYTAYLQQTELEHAQDVLADLLETLVGTLAPVFTLSKLEGDAAFAYAPEGAVGASMLMDTVEAGYFAFRRRLRDIAHATTCECNACVLIPRLDLKYFVHHGEWVARRIAGTEELTGSDVILAHRLMKGTVGETLDKKAYAAYTASTLDAFGMNPEMLRFSSHIDHFDDIGDVQLWVQNLEEAWTFDQERNREYVTSNEAELENVFEIPHPLPIVWEYMTDPGKRASWSVQLDSIDTVTDGRFGVGSTNHCVHGDHRITEHVADWRPFDYATFDYPIPDGTGVLRLTYEFEPTSSGTQVTLRVGPITEDQKNFFAMWKADFDKYIPINTPVMLELMAQEAASRADA